MLSRVFAYTVILILLLVLAFAGGRLAREEGETESGAQEPDLGTGYRYQPATLAKLTKLLEREDWTLAEPPRNAQRMLQVMHERTGLTFVLVPAGSFRMGSPEDEDGRYSDEGPVHTVTVPPFLMCRTKCTQRAWERGGGRRVSFFKGADRPVESVNWKDMRSWCGKAGLRLPSEAEWQYACRAGSTGKWCFGDNESILGQYAEYEGKFLGSTQPVARKSSNAWGLYDMHGNVWEGCEDTYHDSYEGAPTDGSAWTTKGSWYRVSCGGSWTVLARTCRSASRFLCGDLRDFDLGLRPAASLP